MAIALRNAASTSFDAGAGTHASITITKPTGTVDNDVMLAAVTCRSSVSVTAPAGWTQIADQLTTTVNNGGSRTTVFRRVASSEGASYIFSYSATVDDGAVGVILAFSAVSTTTPEDVTATSVQSDTSTDTTINVPAITPVTDGSCHVYFAGINPLSASTTAIALSGTPAGYTPADFTSAVKSNVTVTLRVSLEASHKIISPAAATSAFDITSSKGGRNTGISVALRPDLTQTVTMTGLTSGETFGTLQVDENVALTPITSAEAFGTLRVDENIVLTGITSAEAFGSPRVDLALLFTGIASAEIFGATRVDEGVALTGLVSAETFGTLRVDENVTLTGIASAEVFGSLEVDLTLLLTGIASAENFGTLSVDKGIVFTGLASSEAFGTLRVDLNIVLTGIASGEAFGASFFGRTVTLTGLPSAEAFGTLAVVTTVDVHLLGFFEEAFGFVTFKEPDWWNDLYPFRRKLVLTAPATEPLPPNHPVTVTFPVTSGRRSDYVMPEILAYSPPHLIWLGRELADTGDALSIRFLTVGTVLPGEQAAYYVYYGHIGGIGRPAFTDNPWPVRVGQDSPLVSYTRPREHWKDGRTVVTGARASLSIAAVDVRLTAQTGLEQAIAEVQIDEGGWESVDLFARAGVDEGQVFRRAALSEGVHRVRYQASGRSNPASRGSQVNLVALEYVLPVTISVETEEGYVSHG